MKYDFDKIINREGLGSYKYDKREDVFGSADVLPMWVADMDFEVPPHVAHAIKNRADHEVFGYDAREEDFFTSFTGWISRRGGWDIRKEWVVPTPGVLAGLSFAIESLTAPGDGIVIQPPVYPPFFQIVEATGRKLITNPLTVVDGRYEMDLADLDEKLAGAKAFIFCNPQNPTGRVFSREEIEKVLELCIKHDVIIFSDEIHSDLILKPNKHVHIGSLPGAAERTVTFLAPSKTFNTAGLSTSVAVIADRKLRVQVEREMSKFHVSGGNTFGNIAFRAAYERGEEWLEELLDYLDGNVTYLKQYISSHIPLVKTYSTEGTYLIWLDMRGLGLEDKELQEFLVHKAGLGLNRGTDFGAEGSGHARINVGTSRLTLRRGLEQLKWAVDELSK